MTQWSAADIPPQHGRLAVVTGTGGLGYETARALARVGAHVVLAGRDGQKGAAALERIRAETPHARIVFEALDLADLVSVAAFGDRLKAGHERLDILVNNAGVVRPPQRLLTADGFELQFGTNHLGHFALTAHLLPLLVGAGAARVVSVASLAHRWAKMDFEDLDAARGYHAAKAYGRSKLANLMFAFELQRRSAAAGWGLTSVAAHPGVARTAAIAPGSGAGDIRKRLFRVAGTLLASPEEGARAILFAATAPQAVPGGYYGPTGPAEIRGPVGRAKVSASARDVGAAARLWEVSGQLTGVSFPA